MRASEFINDDLIVEDKSKIVGSFNVGDTQFDVHQHLADQTRFRDVTPSSVNIIVRQLPKVINQIKQFEPGQAFYVADPRYNVSLGFRVMDSGAILVVTAVPSTKPYARGDAPVLMVNQIDKGYKHESK